MTIIEQALTRTAVVVPSIQGRPLLERLLPSIDLPLPQVVVVDQGSSDGSDAYCRNQGAQVLQLGQQASFTQACNAGIRWAMEREFHYVCIANNDLRFVTPVVHQLLATCLDNAAAGAAAPTQVMIADGKIAWVAYRATWDLSVPRFGHEIAPLPNAPRDVDADFCEFTCVMVPAAVFADVGLLDDDYGFYHEDADFGFRLWQKGYRALYNQEAQVFHWGSSTVATALGAQRKRELIQRNLSRFAVKHLRFGVNFVQEGRGESAEPGVSEIVDGFSRTLRPLGLLRPDKPTFAVGQPGRTDSQYLYVVGDPPHPPGSRPESWRKHEEFFVSSAWAGDRFAKAGFANAHVVPAGIDPNIFHPEAPRLELDTCKTFLAIAHTQPDPATDAILAAWRAVEAQLPGAALALLCPGTPIDDGWQGEASVPLVRGNLLRRWYPRQRILVLQPLARLTEAESAMLYRGAHCVVAGSQGGDAGLPILGAMACGTLCIVLKGGVVADLAQEDRCLVVSAVPSQANDAWVPAQADLQRQLLRVGGMPEEERARLTSEARRFVLTRHTWRTSANALHRHLARLQAQPGAVGSAGRRRRVAWERLRDRLVRGYLADGLVRAGGALQKLGRVLRSEGVAQTLRKTAVALGGRVGRRR